MHPTVNDLKSLTDSQLEQKIFKLNSLYFITENPSVRQQMILLLDTYKIELEERRISARKKQEQDGNDDLDSLININ
jgi:hypothetical protein